MAIRNSCLAGLLAAFGAATSLADGPARPEDFAAVYVDAVRSREPQRLKALLHSKSLQCITPANQSLFDWKWERSIARGAPQPYKATASRFEGQVAPGSGRSQWPVHPTHLLRIEFGTGPSTMTTLLALAMEDGRWRTVEPCPGDGGTAPIR